jgi:hypothetical protein
MSFYKFSTAVTPNQVLRIHSEIAPYIQAADEARTDPRNCVNALLLIRPICAENRIDVRQYSAGQKVKVPCLFFSLPESSSIV